MNDTIKSKKKQQGITLIEVLITILVIVIGVLAFAKLQQKLWRHSLLLEQQNQALALAQQKIEELRGFETLNTEAGKFAYQDIASGSSNINRNNTNYIVDWNISDHNNPDYKSVNVTVSWSNNYGNSHNVNLTSIIGKINPALTGKVFQPN